MPRNSEASSIKQTRRTKGEMEAIRQHIIEILEEDWPQNVRQVFYQLASRRRVIAKTEAEYQRTVIRLLTEMRLSGEIPYHRIEDSTRYVRRPDTHETVSDAVRETARFYRLGLWSNQDHTLQVWLEKEALAGVVWDVTWDWDVPLYVCRGYPSLTFIHKASQDIKKDERPCKLIFLGDHDPSGVDIQRHIVERLVEFDCDFEAMRLAVTTEQIRELDLPTRPTKTSDPRSGDFVGDSVELDAIPSKLLKEMIKDEIFETINFKKLKVIRAAEESEKEALRAWANAFENRE